MSNLDDLPLASPSQGLEPSIDPIVRASRGPVLLIAGVGLLIGAGGAWWWTRDRTPPAAPAAARTATDAVVAPATDAARALPPLGQMDIFLRALLGSLSASPEWTRWLATDDLIQQMAHAIDQVSRGGSPARELGVLRPAGIFQSAGPARALTIDPSTYRRFDPLAATVAALDAQAVAAAYQTIRPRLDEAYRGLGRSENSVDQAVAIALQVLIDTPRVDGAIRLVPGPGATLAYADPRLERLAPAQKQLLRMGPENLARVQARLAEIKAALETSRPR